MIAMVINFDAGSVVNQQHWYELFSVLHSKGRDARGQLQHFMKVDRAYNYMHVTVITKYLKFLVIMS